MTRLEDGWVAYLRFISRKARDKAGTCTVNCTFCGLDVPTDLGEFKSHVRADVSAHRSLESDTDIKDAFERITMRSSYVLSSRYDDDDSTLGDTIPDLADSSQREPKKVCPPPVSDTQQRGSSPPTPCAGNRSRARLPTSSKEFDRGYSRGQRPARQLFDPGFDHSYSKTSQRKEPQMQLALPTAQAQNASSQNNIPKDAWVQVDPERPYTSLLPQPETKSISHEQLIAEVKEIYAGLVMIEKKCMEVDTWQSSNKERQPGRKQLKALIALYRTLLHEHHDFFVSSQHPAATNALKRLAAKYALPAGVWRHRYPSFSELFQFWTCPETLTESYKCSRATRFNVDGIFNGFPIEANADTGSSFNVISKELATSMNLTLEPGTQGYIPLPSGEKSLLSRTCQG